MFSQKLEGTTMNNRGHSNDNTIRTNMFLKPRMAHKLREIFHNSLGKDRRQFDIAVSQVYENGLCELIAVRRNPKLSLSHIMNELSRCSNLLQEHCSNSSAPNDDFNNTIELSDGDESICIVSPARNDIRKVSFKRTISNDSSIIIENFSNSIRNESISKRPCLDNVSISTSSISESPLKSTSPMQQNLEIRCYNESPHSAYSRNVTLKHSSNPSASTPECPSVSQDDEADMSVMILDVCEDLKPSAPTWTSGICPLSSVSQSQKGQTSRECNKSFQKNSSIWSELTGKASVWLKNALTHSNLNKSNDGEIQSKKCGSEVLNENRNFAPEKSCEVAIACSSEEVSSDRIETAHMSQNNKENTCKNLGMQESSLRNVADEAENIHNQNRVGPSQGSLSNSTHLNRVCPESSSYELKKDDSCQNNNEITNLSRVNSTAYDTCADSNISDMSDVITVRSDGLEAAHNSDDNDIIFEKELTKVKTTPTIIIDDGGDDIEDCKIVESFSSDNEVEIVESTIGEKKKKKKKKLNLTGTSASSLPSTSRESAPIISVNSISQSNVSPGSSTSKCAAPDFIPLYSMVESTKPNPFLAKKKKGGPKAAKANVMTKKMKKAVAVQKRIAKYQSLRKASQTPRRSHNQPTLAAKPSEPKEGEKKHVYDGNVMNPNAGDVPQTGLRPIVIDASNVAVGHGRGLFSVKGLKICIKYFMDRGHKVYACAPKFRRFHVSPEDRQALDELETAGILSYTPSRTMVDGTKVASYDDRFIVQIAHELGGVVVSTDNFRDLLAENDAWRETIEKRLLMFTWVGDMLMFPNDPLGRNGPHLQDFLRFPEPPPQQ